MVFVMIVVGLLVAAVVQELALGRRRLRHGASPWRHRSSPPRVDRSTT